MDKENTSLLTLPEYFLIESVLTKKPYFDEEARCYLFEKKSDAQAFSDEIKDTKIAEPKHYRLQFITELYGYGAKGIRIMQRDNVFKDIPVEKGDAKKRYFNPEASLNITLLKQTSKKKYAKALKKAHFLAPVLIDPRFTKRYPELHYSCAVTDDDSRFYILFTTLKEFDEWNNAQPQDWKAVEMQLHKVGRIRKGNSILINPLSDMIILQDKQIMEILKG